MKVEYYEAPSSDEKFFQSVAIPEGTSSTILNRLSYVEPSLHLWNKAYLVMVDNVFDVFLESVCQYFIEYLCIYVHEGDCCYISNFISDFINLDALSLPFGILMQREDVILEWIFLPCKPNKKLKTYIEKISDLIHKGTALIPILLLTNSGAAGAPDLLLCQQVPRCGDRIYNSLEQCCEVDNILSINQTRLCGPGCIYCPCFELCCPESFGPQKKFVIKLKIQGKRSHSSSSPISGDCARLGENKDVYTPKLGVKSMLMENIILKEITQTQKDKRRKYVLIHKWILDVKQRITRLRPIAPEKLANKEDPKRDSWVAWSVGELRMALMAGTARRHSSALEGTISQTPGAAQNNSSALKVFQTPGAAQNNSSALKVFQTPGAAQNNSSALKVSQTPGAAQNNSSALKVFQTPGAAQNNSSALKVSQTPGAAQNNSSALKVSQTPGAAQNNSSALKVFQTPGAAQNNSSALK
ncbi:hypothetical protein STEG23_017921, partial [Scotinomys teguina]